MPGGAFRLLVAAIAAVALLGIIYIYFFQPQDPIAIISEGFDKAEIGANKIHRLGKIVFPTGFGLNAKSFDSKTRTASFKCNSTDCQINSGGDSRVISFKNKIGLEASIRCVYDFGLSVCTLYLGEIPAQLEAIGAKVSPEKPDFVNAKTISVGFGAGNSGKAEAKEARALVELYRKTGEGRELQDSKQIVIGEVKAGESIKQNSSLSLKGPGEHEVVVTIEGDDAGRDVKTISFIVFDSTPSACAAERQESFSIYEPETKKCRQRLYCDSCVYGFECENAWNAKLPGAEIAAGDRTIAYKITDSIGGQCPGT